MKRIFTLLIFSMFPISAFSITNLGVYVLEHLPNLVEEARADAARSPAEAESLTIILNQRQYTITAPVRQAAQILLDSKSPEVRAVGLVGSQEGHLLIMGRYPRPVLPDSDLLILARLIRDIEPELMREARANQVSGGFTSGFAGVLSGLIQHAQDIIAPGSLGDTFIKSEELLKNMKSKLASETDEEKKRLIQQAVSTLESAPLTQSDVQPVTSSPKVQIPGPIEQPRSTQPKGLSSSHGPQAGGFSMLVLWMAGICVLGAGWLFMKRRI